MSLPQSLRLLGQMVLLDENVFPRRHRDATKQDGDNPIFQGLLESAEQRTLRLFRSFDELDREVWGSASHPSISTSQSKTDADPCWYSLHSFGALWWNHWKSTLGRACSVQVPDNDITEEFREARRHGLGRDPSHEPGDRRQRKVVDDDKNWVYYQLRRASRHRWGQYLCSNMDWEWDLGACMERLFTAEKQIREGPSTAGRRTSASSIEIDMGVVPGESWSLMAEEAHGILPKEVKISYRTKDGRTQYMLFVPASSNPSPHHPVFGTSCSGPSAGEQEIESLHTSSSYSDASHSNTYEGTPGEAINDDREGKD